MVSKYAGKMDAECVNLCNAINKLPGLHTTESCCGHKEKPFSIWFETKDLESLPALLYWFDPCHCGFNEWKVIAKTDCAMSPVYFHIEGGIGAFDEANEIAKLLES